MLRAGVEVYTAQSAVECRSTVYLAAIDFAVLFDTKIRIDVGMVWNNFKYYYGSI